MTAIISKTAIGVAAALAFGASAASAVTVVNGSFEEDPGFVATDGQSFGTLVTGTGNNSWSVFTSLPGWSVVSGPGVEVQTTNTLGTINPQDQDHYVELDSNSNSSILQSINFTSTGSYLLSFWYSPRDGNAASNIIDYSLGPLLSGSVTGPSNVVPVTAVGLWTLIEATFVVTQTGSYNLVFTANGTNNSLGGFIDNVSIAAVPVPAGGLLLLGSVAGLIALHPLKTA